MKVFEVMISKIVGQTWLVEAKTEEEAKEIYSEGKMTQEKTFNPQVEEVSLEYNELECLECGYDMTVEGDTLICQHCSNSITIVEQRKELKKFAKINPLSI